MFKIAAMFMIGASITIASQVAHASLATPGSHGSPAACAGLLPPPGQVETPRPLEAMDLLRLRDIGYMHLGPGQRLLAISPDKRRMAFVMHRADPATNRYCVALVVVEIESGRSSVVLDRGDDIILEAVPIRGVEVDYGLPRVIIPQWSPDGRQLAYLRKVRGVPQVVLVDLRTHSTRAVTRSAAGAEHFTWSSDGRAILFSNRPALLAARVAIEAEGQQGYLYDERILPYKGTTPAVRSPKTEDMHAVQMNESEPRDVTAQERDRLTRAKAVDRENASSKWHFPSGWSLEKAQDVPGSYGSPTFLVATSPAGKLFRCERSACAANLFFDFEGIWETDVAGEFAYLKRQGWGGSMLGLYLWRPGSSPRRLFETQDVLVGCESLGRRLACTRESALRPRRVVTIDLRRQGRTNELFDPNPQFATLSTSSAKRLHWRNARGQESYGDLVLPAHVPAGKRLPLVIIQYVTRGFLRGGTGDEYPIQLFAKNGFAVLSFQKPAPLFAATRSDSSLEKVIERMSINWEDRRNIHSSLLTALQQLLKRGDIDAARIGISGVSDGSTTVQFGLVNSPGLFKAASVGSCCVDPTSMMIYGGSGLARERQKWGYPPPSGQGSDAWRQISLALQSPDKMAPLLMQLADSEFLVAMETLAAYENREQSIEARIFPQEFHLKVQPQHRLAVYCRNLQWFAFWLEQPIDEVACPLATMDEKRWSAMRNASNRNVHTSG